MRVNQNDLYHHNNIPNFIITRGFNNFGFPMQIQISGDIGNNLLTNVDLNYKKFSGGVRVSGRNLFNRITFDTIYKFRGYDSNTLDNYHGDYNPGGTLQPDGTGISSHSFGLYTNIFNIPNLQTGLGYSGYLRIFEDNQEKTGARITRTGPLFNGFDLRFFYTGIPNISIGSANNISFAGVDTSSAEKISVGVLGLNLPAGHSQSWLTMFNQLRFTYRFSSLFSAAIHGEYYTGIITTTTPVSEIIRTKYWFGGGIYSSYQFSRNLFLGAGLNLIQRTDSYTNSDSDAQKTPATRNASGGTFQIEIPISVSFYFR